MPQLGPRPLPPAGLRLPALAVLALVLLVLLAYANSFGAPFLFDDYESIEANPTIKHLSALGDVLSPPNKGSGVTGRPVVNLSLALNYAISGTSVRGYHVTNVALHLLAGLALFGIVRRTLLLPALRERFGDDALRLALITAALWLVHPLQTESVTCVVQRTEVLMGLFYLSTLYAFIRAAEEPASRRWPVACGASCLLGMASKEVMVSAPLIILLYDRTFVAGTFSQAWRQRRTLYLGLAGTWLLLIFLLLKLGGTRGESAGLGLGVSPFAYALKQCEAIPRYLQLVFWPHPLVLDYGETLAVPRGLIWFDAAFLALLLAGAAVALWRWPMLGFLGAWFFAILAPSSSVVPLLTQTVAEHRMYLPLAAVVVLIVVGLAPWRHGRRAGAILLAVAGLAGLTALRNHDYRTGLAIWSDNVAKTPRNSRAHYNLGVEWTRLPGHSADALVEFRRALDCKPTDAAAHFGLARELARIPANASLAIAHYEEALRITPANVAARIDLANELARQPGRRLEAIRHYELALYLDPTSAVAHNNFANELAKIPGFEASAIEHYGQAFRLRPDDAESHFNLALLLARQPKRAGEAIAQFNEALRLKPDFAAAHFNLGVLHANHGRRDEAIREFERVLELDANAADARDNLALLRGDAK